MRFWENFRVAFRALRANKLRSFLTMLGIIIGVASVIAMVAIGAGAQARVIEQIRTLGANLLMVTPGAAREGAARMESGSRHTLTEADAVAIAARLPFVAASAPSVRGTAQIVRGNQNWRTAINGTIGNYFVAREWPLQAGRYFTQQEQASAGKVAIIGQTVAEELFGEDSPLGERIRILNTPFEVIAVLGEKGTSGLGSDQDDVVFVPISTAKQRLIGSAHQINRGAVNYILVKVASEDLMTVAEAQITALLRQRHRLPASQDKDFEVNNPAAAMSAQHEASRTIALLLAAVASVSLIVGGISIMNIMLVSVTERTREIGLRVAVGARRKDIRNQFLIEAVLLCLLGGGAGVALGIGAALTMGTMSGWPIFLGPETITLAIGFAGAVGVFFGYYPASKASKLDPIEALRFE